MHGLMINLKAELTNRKVKFGVKDTKAVLVPAAASGARSSGAMSVDSSGKGKGTSSSSGKLSVSLSDGIFFLKMNINGP